MSSYVTALEHFNEDLISLVVIVAIRGVVA